MRILYLAHDLSDDAIWRRVEMLSVGGAEVHLAGFSRKEPAIKGPARTMRCFGLTFNGGFRQRIGAVCQSYISLRDLLKGTPKPDVIIARNLEMLALAPKVRRVLKVRKVPIVYECLDIHALMLRKNPIGAILRGIERQLMRRTALLITSSPGFVRNYFEPYGQNAPETMVIENKMLYTPASNRSVGIQDDTIRIGWFGILRCQASLHLLDQMTRDANGRIKVSLRGKPAYDVMPDFDDVIADNHYLSFGGPYRYPDDLAEIYGQVRFSWLIDLYQQGENSDWLLPNRLYEGCAHGAVPIVRAGTEVARFVEARDMGIVVGDLHPDTIGDALLEMSEQDVLAVRSAVASQHRSAWTIQHEDSLDLVDKLYSLIPDHAQHSAQILAEQHG
ncbi:glycosyl transferase [Pseudaestuariivita rosea]|uniref:glycosyl transferase n=1 Tax=Pseudaestuariivita rosea TaxID=2763263 RepID=UPI001ABADD1E|nr:glycosyl transferase [Pseudaestuariivita rosea]